MSTGQKFRLERFEMHFLNEDKALLTRVFWKLQEFDCMKFYVDLRRTIYFDQS